MRVCMRSGVILLLTGIGCSSGVAGGGGSGVVEYLTLGFDFSCARLSGNRVKCWGNNELGQLGLGDTERRGDGPNEMGKELPFVDLGTGNTAKMISAGWFHACAVLQDRRVKCWGDNVGRLGLGDEDSRGDGPNELGDQLPPVDLGTGITAVAVAAGALHTCALLHDGTVKCWGDNAYGALGVGPGGGFARGDEPNEMGDNLPRVDFGTGAVATAIETGSSTTCVLLAGGSVKCWGRNDSGQLGVGHTMSIGEDPLEMGDHLVPIDLGTGRTAKAIAVGGCYACALLDDGSVKCWGCGAMLGTGDTEHRGDMPNEMGDHLPAVDLGNGKTAIAIRAAVTTTCATLNDGTVKCWGYNDSGQLGLGDTQIHGDQPNDMGDNLPALNLGTSKTATLIAPGYRHTCAVLNDGSSKCWGANVDGALGLGDAVWRGDMPGEMGDALPAVKLFSDLW